MEGLDPNLVTLLVFAAGYVLSRWDRQGAQQSKSGQIDAELLARIAHVEVWQRDHNTIHGCVQSLRATTEAMSKNVDRMTRRIDSFIASFPPMSARARQPFGFQGRDWVLDGEEAQ